jgi:nucleoid-associated protein YgaU
MGKEKVLQRLLALLLVGIAVFASMSYIKSFHDKNALPGAVVEMKTNEVVGEEKKAIPQQQKAGKVEIKYYVTADDTLEKISQRMYGTGDYVDEIAKYNHINDMNMIHAGDILLIPIQE